MYWRSIGTAHLGQVHLERMHGTDRLVVDLAEAAVDDPHTGPGPFNLHVSSSDAIRPHAVRVPFGHNLRSAC